ncbi:CRISPR-associated protein, Cmr5 family [Bernardetia litoralis DSM 6794]|uniref:CRISPR type III-B/RAMP module-associated protein Cmr5 n=1 Tax=Bernardetia litoralis (strain ATCC 23117 / DSM 6794 / NBRC 15988 / NCIMB 1366 / Fx l1 / Sio-4) TaxID=880071 RepID=I4AP47_BERLS|nr:type III-B CRISPR module-associated protein Cmr5 [Bernardetia litoralis]AFM05732.1 CRISPR-associated protein, Cmr5 family [Bernardetia litoralis DSM 6794]
MSNRKKLEQGRAEFAYQCAEKGNEVSLKKTDVFENEVYYKDSKYKSYVKSIPMMIKANGLGATFAFILSKGAKDKKSDKAGTEKNPKNAYDLIYLQTYNYLSSFDKLDLFDNTKKEDLVNVIISKDSSQYRYLTVETLAFFNWLRRFAEGLVKGGEDE